MKVSTRKAYEHRYHIYYEDYDPIWIAGELYIQEDPDCTEEMKKIIRHEEFNISKKLLRRYHLDKNAEKRRMNTGLIKKSDL